MALPEVARLAIGPAHRQTGDRHQLASTWLSPDLEEPAALRSPRRHAFLFPRDLLHRQHPPYQPGDDDGGEQRDDASLQQSTAPPLLLAPPQIMPFDFSRSTIPLDQTVTLYASEQGAPPAGRFAAVEIRIADGWNYYFEYRVTQTGQIGDQELGGPGETATGAVLGT